MNPSDVDEIYVSLIDGVQVWIPVKTKPLADGQHLILSNNEFDSTDYSSLLEFIPGDTVAIGHKKFKDGNTKRVAVSLIKPSTHPDKKFFEFLYHATIGDISVDKITLDKYRNEIIRVKKEFKEGRYFYPTISDTIGKLEKLEMTK